MDWNKIGEESLLVLDQVLNGLRQPVEDLAQALARTFRAGGKLLVCGNGGSAADAQHLAGELVNRFYRERAPYPALALGTDLSVLTSIANDYSYDQVFAKQVAALGQPGDMLLAISTSGNARNVLAAVRQARQQKLHTVALTGGSGGELARAAERVVSVTCTATVPRIQEGHQLFIHLLCERIEELMA
jgi:D-sedoheptulose 7-phosphate isomerase